MNFLKNINLSFFYGAKIGIIGLNGSGKSTLIKIIAGLDTSFQGDVHFSKDHTIGYLAQEPELDESKTVMDIVKEGMQEAVDLIAEYNGELSIIDYKTKRKPQIDDYMYEYYLQTTCYAQMFHEVTGQKINQIVILVSSEKNTRQEFIKTCDNYIEPMKERIENYYLNNIA
mgnify:CR=1 FL=1